jgi:hypothetical protein
MGLESQDSTPAELATAFQKIGKLIVAASQLDVSHQQAHRSHSRAGEKSCGGHAYSLD